MKDYYDDPYDYLCPICRNEECEGCPGIETWYDEPDSIWDEPEHDLTAAEQRIVDEDIYAEREEQLNGN